MVGWACSLRRSFAVPASLSSAASRSSCPAIRHAGVVVAWACWPCRSFAARPSRPRLRRLSFVVRSGRACVRAGQAGVVIHASASLRVVGHRSLSPSLLPRPSPRPRGKEVSTHFFFLTALDAAWLEGAGTPACLEGAGGLGWRVCARAWSSNGRAGVPRGRACIVVVRARPGAPG